MTRDHDPAAQADAAWTAFRQRLADHLATMVDGAELVVSYVDLTDSDLPPYVDVLSADGGLVLTAASDAFLPDESPLTVEQVDLLVGLGWLPPDVDVDRQGFELEVPQREADRAAVLLVRTLSEVHGVPHPAFLDAEGLEINGPIVAVATEPGASDEAESPDDAAAHAFVMPMTVTHLEELVEAALGAVFPDVRHDEEGDIPLRSGHSVLFVRVRHDRPAVELFAHVVLRPTDPDRLPLELGLLNRDQELWRFHALDDRVVMSYELVTTPFAAQQLLHVVHRFLADVDDVAADLVARVGGRRFLEAVRARRTSPAPVVDDELPIVGLLELCHLGRPRTRAVAELFDHDRSAIIRQIIRIRSGQQHCDGHDEDVVLTALRKALRLVSDGRESGPVAVPSRPRTVQPSLLADDDLDEDTLDLGWPA
ncbi:MAG: hypothetical protein JWN84_1653 [Nocardioides sp.]|nr:hypothetical protein [Nocardioides sp.]